MKLEEALKIYRNGGKIRHKYWCDGIFISNKVWHFLSYREDFLLNRDSIDGDGWEEFEDKFIMTFTQAVEKLKRGKKIARKESFRNRYLFVRHDEVHYYNVGNEYRGSFVLFMKDLEATDWGVVDD